MTVGSNGGLDPEARYAGTVELPGRVWVEVAALAKATGATAEATIEAALLRRLCAVTVAEARAMRELVPGPGLEGHSPRVARVHR